MPFDKNSGTSDGTKTLLGCLDNLALLFSICCGIKACTLFGSNVSKSWILFESNVLIVS